MNTWLTRNGSLWNYQPSPSTSWSLKKLLKLTPIAQTVFQQLNGSFNTKQVWQITRLKNQKVNWHRLIWFTNNIPKHSIISWMAILDRLATKDRLLKWGINISDDKCLLCRQQQESRNHLVFECIYSKELWQRVLRLCGILRTPTDWSSELSWNIKNFKGRSLLSLFCRLGWCAVIYHIWRERNSRLHGGPARPTSQVLMCIAQVIQSRIYSLKHISADPVNRFLCNSWGVCHNILEV